VAATLVRLATLLLASETTEPAKEVAALKSLPPIEMPEEMMLPTMEVPCLKALSASEVAVAMAPDASDVAVLKTLSAKEVAVETTPPTREVTESMVSPMSGFADALQARTARMGRAEKRIVKEVARWFGWREVDLRGWI
jgi:hypothetical protein